MGVALSRLAMRVVPGTRAIQTRRAVPATQARRTRRVVPATQGALQTRPAESRSS